MTSCCDPRKATCPEKTLVGCSIGSTVIGCTMMIVGLITLIANSARICVMNCSSETDSQLQQRIVRQLKGCSIMLMGFLKLAAAITELVTATGFCCGSSFNSSCQIYALVAAGTLRIGAIGSFVWLMVLSYGQQASYVDPADIFWHVILLILIVGVLLLDVLVVMMLRRVPATQTETHADSQELNTPPLAMHGVSVGVAVPIAVPIVSP